MSLLDELAAERAGRPVGARCSVGILYDALDAPTAAELRTALADTTLPSTVIAEVLTRRGHDVSDQALARHRRQGRGGGCKCVTL